MSSYVCLGAILLAIGWLFTCTYKWHFSSDVSRILLVVSIISYMGYYLFFLSGAMGYENEKKTYFSQLWNGIYDSWNKICKIKIKLDRWQTLSVKSSYLATFNLISSYWTTIPNSNLIRANQYLSARNLKWVASPFLRVVEYFN